MEFTCHDHSSHTLVVTFNRSHVSIGRNYTPRSLFYCLFAPPIYGVVLRAHSVRGESHIQHNATGDVATLVNIKTTRQLYVTLETTRKYHNKKYQEKFTGTSSHPVPEATCLISLASAVELSGVATGEDFGWRGIIRFRRVVFFDVIKEGLAILGRVQNYLKTNNRKFAVDVSHEVYFKNCYTVAPV